MTFTEMIQKAMEGQQPKKQTVQISKPLCAVCLANENSLNEQGQCAYCAQAIERGYFVGYKQGRNWNGAHRDSGTLYHARPVDENGHLSWTALCGTQPGRTSGGWSYIDDHPTLEVTCKRCLKKLSKLAGKYHASTNSK